MKTKLILAVIIVIGLLSGCDQKTKTNNIKSETPSNSIVGEWIKVGHYGPVRFDFKESGLIEGDFGNDGTIDVVAKYELSGDTIKFIDKEGKMCQGAGKYKMYQTKYYVSFDLIDDDCMGRIKTTLGFWVKPNFEATLKELNQKISDTPKADLYLYRARVYMAIGKSRKAKSDLDIYLKSDTTNARVYINRAGTRFPNDMKGVVLDCNKSIALYSGDKNAYFLRGLALYKLGEKKQACEDFSKAIELGFSILRIAEQEKCAECWDKE